MSHLTVCLADLRGQRTGRSVWCGPAVVARLLHCSYECAVERIRTAGIANGRPYSQKRELSFTFLKDVQKALLDGGVELGAEDSFFHALRRPTVAQWASDKPAGSFWFLLVTGHFEILKVGPAGIVQCYDSFREGQILTGKGRYSLRTRVSYAYQILNAPGLS